MNQLFEPGFCYWATLNPCTECKDKSKCLECTKSVEYVQTIHNEMVKNLENEKNKDKIISCSFSEFDNQIFSHQMFSATKFFNKLKNSKDQIDNCIRNYLQDKPKIKRVLYFANNPCHFAFITEDNHIHEVNIFFDNLNNKFQVEITSQEEENERNKI